MLFHVLQLSFVVSIFIVVRNNSGAHFLQKIQRKPCASMKYILAAFEPRFVHRCRHEIRRLIEKSNNLETDTSWKCWEVITVNETRIHECANQTVTFFKNAKKTLPFQEVYFDIIWTKICEFAAFADLEFAAFADTRSGDLSRI